MRKLFLRVEQSGSAFYFRLLAYAGCWDRKLALPSKDLSLNRDPNTVLPEFDHWSGYKTVLHIFRAWALGSWPLVTSISIHLSLN